MNQISLYVIIALLLLNMATGGLYYKTKSDLTIANASLENCKLANTTTNTTVDVKETLNDADNTAGANQASNVATNTADLTNRNNELDNLYNVAKDKLDSKSQENHLLRVELDKLKKQPATEQREMTDAEAKEVSTYLDTTVPDQLERMLHIR